MSRFPIFTRADVEKCYFPSLITEDFVPTHQVRLLNFRDRQVLLTDFVRLDERPTQHGVLYAYGPVESEPLYGVLSTGLWKSLTMHGHPKATQIRYQKHYIPPNEREGFVYFIQALDEGSIKIGWSQEVPRRR